MTSRPPRQAPASRSHPVSRAVETVELRIEAVGAQGDGLAADPASASKDPIYSSFTLPGERVLARVTSGRGEVERVVEPSPERAAPPCPHFGVCGGCALQHWAHPPYLAWKAEQIRRALARERIETEIAPGYAAPPGSRRRVALHARRAEGGRARLGYKQRRSWALVEVAVCPIADARLVAAFPALRRLAEPFLEHPKSAPTLHVTLSATGLDVEVTGVERKSGGLSRDAHARAAEAAAAADLARVTLAGELLYQTRAPLVHLGAATVAIPPGAFLQAVPEAERFIAELAREAVRGAKHVAELFCGVGSFTFRLAEVAPVHAVDGAAPAVQALKAAAGSAPGLKPISVEARDLDRRPLSTLELKRFDAAVFDPPRAGAPAQARAIAEAPGVSRVVGVSCNPATFARDARVLIDGGFRLSRAAPVDQFLWSPHIELVGMFER